MMDTIFNFYYVVCAVAFLLIFVFYLRGKVTAMVVAAGAMAIVVGLGILTFVGQWKREQERQALYHRVLGPNLSDPSISYVINAYASLCHDGFEDVSQPCNVVVAQSITGSTLTSNQKRRALQYVAQHTNSAINQRP